MSHPPKDGEVYKTTCFKADSLTAILDGDDLTVTVGNTDGYFKAGALYVWHVRPAPVDHFTGE